MSPDMALSQWWGHRSTRAAMHPEWSELLAVFRQTEIFRELTEEALRRAIGQRAFSTPTPQALGALYDAYYAGESAAQSGMKRRREDRYFAVRASEKLSAKRLVAGLCLLTPELGPVRLVENGTLRLQVGMTHATVPKTEIRLDACGAGLPSRTVPVATLVRAVNEILSAHRIDQRFIPLDGPEGLEAYLGLDFAQLHALVHTRLFEAPLIALEHFGCFPERSGITVLPEARPPEETPEAHSIAAA